MIEVLNFYKIKTFKEYEDILGIEPIYFDNYYMAVQEAIGILKRFTIESSISNFKIINTDRFIVLKHEIKGEKIDGPMVWVVPEELRVWRSEQ